jgi:hypothetical protein
MIDVAQSLSIPLGRHTGDERRRLVSPLRAADVLPSGAPILPLREHGTPDDDRMQLFAPILRARLA